MLLLLVIFQVHGGSGKPSLLLTSTQFQVLQEVDGDADAAIEYLIAQQGSEESLHANDELCGSENNNHGNGQLVHYSYYPAESYLVSSPEGLVFSKSVCSISFFLHLM